MSSKALGAMSCLDPAYPHVSCASAVEVQLLHLVLAFTGLPANPSIGSGPAQLGLPCKHLWGIEVSVACIRRWVSDSCMSACINHNHRWDWRLDAGAHRSLVFFLHPYSWAGRWRGGATQMKHILGSLELPHFFSRPSISTHRGNQESLPSTISIFYWLLSIPALKTKTTIKTMSLLLCSKLVLFRWFRGRNRSPRGVQ